MRFFRFFTVLFLIIVSYTSNATNIDISSNNWSELAKSDNQALKKLAGWFLIINGKETNFYKITKFIKDNPNWPKQDALMRRVEESDFSSAKIEDIIAWFNKYPTKNLSTRKKLFLFTKDLNIIKKIWHENLLSKNDEREIFKKYLKLIKQEDIIKRIDYMLYNHQTEQAFRLLSYIPKNLRPLYETSIRLQQNKPDALPDYLHLPKQQQEEAGILHNLAHYYENKKDEENLIKILDKTSRLHPNQQFYFWNMKSKLIRNLVIEKNYKVAYHFASTHGQVAAKDLSEAEWLSGWISLRFLNDPKKAIIHFNKVYDNVKLPISIARASYWLARSYEQLNNNELAEKWYKIASKHYVSFYGQLAICKLDNCNLTLPKDPQINKISAEAFNNNILVNAAKILDKTKYNHLVQEFLTKAIENSSNEGEIALITKIGFELEKSHLSVEMAKHASYKNINVITSNYPIPNNIFKEHPLDHSLVLALIRQESLFDHKAISTAGARGLMQIMPHVAKETAKNIKISYHLSRLNNDPHYNSILGATHLNSLLNSYNGSYILSIAAYNAGSASVSKWINSNGDPRNIDNINEIIDWMEKITFYETRNYVQRVLEGKSIYNLLINKNNKLPLLKDLINHYQHINKK